LFFGPVKVALVRAATTMDPIRAVANDDPRFCAVYSRPPTSLRAASPTLD
jgi:hypothetical protein